MSALSLLLRRYAPPEWTFFAEVKDHVGFGSRRADGIAVNMWSTRGLAMHGFEIKADRRDWLRERDNPEKAETIGQFCDYWWLVTEDERVATADEIPDAWGFMVALKDKLKVIKKAPKRAKPTPWTKAFVAELLRSAGSNVVPRSELRRLVDAEVAKRLESHRDHELYRAKLDAEQYKKYFEDLRATVDAFEQAAHLKIREYLKPPEKIGAAVRFVVDGGLSGQARQLEHARTTIRDALQSVESAIDAANAIAKGGSCAHGAPACDECVAHDTLSAMSS